MRDDRKQNRKKFLLQLLATTLAACMIPMVFLSVRMIASHRLQMHENERNRLQDTSERAAARFDECMQAINTMQYQHLSRAEFSDAELDSGISSEIMVIDILEIRSQNQPFFASMGIIRLADPNVVYLTNGKHQLKYFAPNYLSMQENELLEKIAQMDAGAFLPWNESTRCAVYLYPEYRLGQKPVNRIGIYIISRSTLLSSMGHLLMDGVELDQIADQNGQIIFQNSDPISHQIWEADGDYMVSLHDTSYYRASASTPQGITVYLHKSEASILNQLQEQTSSLTLIIVIIAGATMLCALLTVWYNYHPIKQVISRIDDDSVQGETRNELQFLYNAYSEQKNERQQLQNKLDQQRRMILDRIYKCLLNGRTLTNHEFELLHWQNTCFFVAVCDMVETAALDDARIQRLLECHIRVVNLKADRVDAFICFVNDESRKEQFRQIQNIKKFLSPSIRLGVSRVYQALEGFHTAYIESTLAEQAADENGISFVDDLSTHQMPIFYENHFDTMQLINQLHNNDSAALDTVSRMLNHVEYNSTDESSKRYAEFRLLEYLRQAMSKADVPNDEWQFAQILSLPTANQRRDAILQLIRESLRARSETLALERDQLAQEMMLYIEENYCDSCLSLEMLADRFDLSPTAASRIFKEVVGSNFKKYVNERRMTQAKLLLDTTKESVAVISEKVGFSSASYFIQVFKTSEGMTPANWREKTNDDHARS